MPECAFCSSTAKLSAEHIVSDWMESLFPATKEMEFKDSRGNVRQWTSEKINWKARVVCEPCNNGWMSDIEKDHAKPILTPLIKGKAGIPIDVAAARSIALFAFKTAIVMNHAQHRNQPWFPRELRHSFRERKLISREVKIWIAGIARHRKAIHLDSAYFAGEAEPGLFVQSYVCTGAIGCFVFQVRSANQTGVLKKPTPSYRYTDYTIPVWPGLLKGAVWPLPRKLEGASDFRMFHRRWKHFTTSGLSR